MRARRALEGNSKGTRRGLEGRGLQGCLLADEGSKDTRRGLEGDSKGVAFRGAHVCPLVAVSAPLEASLCKPWRADVVAIGSECATGSFLGQASESRFYVSSSPGVHSCVLGAQFPVLMWEPHCVHLLCHLGCPIVYSSSYTKMNAP